MESPTYPGMKDTTGLPPLHWAAQQGDVDVVRMLVAHKADIDAKDPSHLLIATMTFHAQVIGGMHAECLHTHMYLDLNKCNPPQCPHAQTKNVFVCLICAYIDK